MRQASRWSAAVAVAAWSIACGSGDDPLSRASGPSMEPSAQSGPAAVIERAAGTRVPRIESVRFVPPRPATGETVRASAHSSEADDDPLSFDFVWTVGGQRLAQRGPEITLTRARQGDSIEVRLADGTVYEYRVTVRYSVDPTTADVGSIVGPTQREIITLITCGGNLGTEYDQRLIGLAERVLT